MIGTIPDHDAQLLRGAPLDDAPETIEIDFKIRTTTPVRSETPHGTAWMDARGIVLSHFLKHTQAGWDPDTVRRAVQVDLDVDLDPDDFAALANDWPKSPDPGSFTDQEALDAFETDLEDLLRIAGFTKGQGAI